MGAVLYAVKAMLGALQLLVGRSGAQNAKVAIDLGAIGIDDDAVDLLSKGKGQRRLAARGRPGDEGQRRTRLGHGDRDADSSGKAR